METALPNTSAMRHVSATAISVMAPPMRALMDRLPSKLKTVSGTIRLPRDGQTKKVCLDCDIRLRIIASVSFAHGLFQPARLSPQSSHPTQQAQLRSCLFTECLPRFLFSPNVLST
jgi:hypothetical protein